jgi:hypothetical protein
MLGPFFCSTFRDGGFFSAFTTLKEGSDSDSEFMEDSITFTFSNGVIVLDIGS